MEKKIYKNSFKISHRILSGMPKDTLGGIKLNYKMDAVKNVLVDGLTNMEIEGVYIDTTKPIPREWLTMDCFSYYKDLYMSLRLMNENQFLVTIGAW